MNNIKIAFIGAGNMARAIIGGLVAQGFPAANIHASGPRQTTLDEVAALYPIATGTDNLAAAAAADVVVFAVKPQLLKEVAQALAPALGHKPLVISLAAGITTDSIGAWLGGAAAIVRCMPNTPSQLRLGASGLYANTQVSAAQRALAGSILAAVGIVEWVAEEPLLNAVTAVSGSGPAYFFYMMEAMIDAGVKQGLSRSAATALTLQTALGAAQLAQQSDVDVAELRRRVTSPKGTTEQAILSFERDGLPQMVERALGACSHRAEELSQLLGN